MAISKRDFTNFMEVRHAQYIKVKFACSGSFADMTMRYLNTVRRLPIPRDGRCRSRVSS